MPLCIYCSKTIECTCSKAPQPIGQTVQGCPKKIPGKLWIHVMDDEGKDIEGVLVKGSSEKPTSATGLAIFEPVTGALVAELNPLSSTLAKLYEMPAEEGQRKRPVTVYDGALAYVQFTLARKVKLKIEFVFKPTPKTSNDLAPFKASKIKVTVKGPGGTDTPETATGIIELDLSPGSYEVTPDYKEVVKDDFDYKVETRTQTLTSGKPTTLTFELVRKAKLKVDIIYKRDNKSDPEEYFKLFDGDPDYKVKDTLVSIAADFAGNDYGAKGSTVTPLLDGVADFKIVTAGKYEIKPDFSKVGCRLEFEDKSYPVELFGGEEECLKIEVEPLYWDVQFLANCLLTVPDKFYKLGPGESLVPTGTTDPAEAPFILKGMLTGEWKGAYHGPEKDSDDIDARVKYLEYALGEAYSMAEARRTVLKVFIVPECFFQGRYGAYLFENFGHLFQKLMELVKADKWKDWVFAFGTVNCIETGVSIDPITKKEIGTGIAQMMNYAPVFRGGPIPRPKEGGGGELDPQFRLIQKLVNSAELLDDVEVEPHSGYDAKIRKIAVNQDVQFQSTQNEDEFASVLRRFYDTDDKDHFDAKAKEICCITGKLPEDRWTSLIAALKAEINTLGLHRVVRSIRVSNIDGLPDDLKSWDFGGFQDMKSAHMDTNKVRIASLRPLAFALIAKQWELDFETNPSLYPKNAVKPLFNPKFWKSAIGTARLTRILTAARNAIGSSGAVSYQQLALEGVIDAVMADHAKVSAFFDNSPLKRLMTEKWDQDYVKAPLKRLTTVLPAPAFGVDAWITLMDATNQDRINRIHQAVRDGMDAEALTLSCAKSALEKELNDLLLNREQASANFEPSPEAPAFGLSMYPIWKKMVQLYCKEKPVAGIVMTPAPSNMNYRDYCFVGARKRGPFLTWDEAAKIVDPCKKLAFGLEICADHTAGRLQAALASSGLTLDIQLLPSAGMQLAHTFSATRVGGWMFNCDGWRARIGDVTGKEGIHLIHWFKGPEIEGVNPVTPHSALGRGGKVPLDRKALTTGVVVKPLDGALAKDIFAAGAGEIHAYKVQPLPRS